MAVSILPIDADFPDYTVVLTLDDADFLFRVYWQDRRQAWFVDIDRDGQSVTRGKRLVVGNDILLNVPLGTNRPVGGIFVLDTTGQDRDPARDDLGQRVLVAYRTD